MGIADAKRACPQLVLVSDSRMVVSDFRGHELRTGTGQASAARQQGLQAQQG